MADDEQASREELLAELRALRAAAARHAEREAELERHRAQLESQNRHLREVQHEVESAYARYADLYDFAPSAYCTFDRAGLILEINLTGALLLRRDRNHVIGLPFQGFVGRESLRAFLDHLSRCAVSAGATTGEITLQGHDAPSTIVHMVSVPTWDPVTGAAAYRTTLTDITARKQAEDALRVAVRMREDFLAIVSHDLRNPLNAIVMGAELLLQTRPADERRRFGKRQLEAMRRAASRMNRMLSDLLDLSSMDAGQLSMERGVHEIEDIFTAVVEIWRPQALEKRIELATRIEGEPATAYCDRERTIQALLNLVGNGVKFASPGGHVTLEARIERYGVRFAVRDDGPGIAPDHLEHIFNPYWQVEKSAKKGTGLGLSIAKGIVECHGGALSVRSQLGEGATFFFTLPTPVARRPSSPFAAVVTE